MLSDTKKISKVEELFFDSKGKLTTLGGIVYIFAAISYFNALRKVQNNDNK